MRRPGLRGTFRTFIYGLFITMVVVGLVYSLWPKRASPMLKVPPIDPPPPGSGPKQDTESNLALAKTLLENANAKVTSLEKERADLLRELKTLQSRVDAHLPVTPLPLPVVPCPPPIATPPQVIVKYEPVLSDGQRLPGTAGKVHLPLNLTPSLSTGPLIPLRSAIIFRPERRSVRS